MNIWDTGTLLLKLISPTMYETKLSSDIIKAKEKYKQIMNTIIPLKHEFDILDKLSKKIAQPDIIKKIDDKLSSTRVKAKMLEARLAQEMSISGKLKEFKRLAKTDRIYKMHAKAAFYKQRTKLSGEQDMAAPMTEAQDIVLHLKSKAHPVNKDDLRKIDNVLKYMKGFNKGLFLLRDIILKEKELNKITLEKI